MFYSSRTWIWIVAVAHVVFSLAELTLWPILTPALKIYTDNDRATAIEQARATSPVGRNMGLYNGIVAACLMWLLLVPNLGPEHLKSLATLLLSCVILAGLFGGVTIKWTIPLFQSLPAAYALYLLWRDRMG